MLKMREEEVHERDERRGSLQQNWGLDGADSLAEEKKKKRESE
jgi:hypothetical protein